MCARRAAKYARLIKTNSSIGLYHTRCKIACSPVPAHNQAASNTAPSDLRAYLDEVWRCLPAFAIRAAGLPAEERGSFEWQVSAGQFWWSAREAAGVPRETAAQTLGCSVNRLRLLEYGLVSPSSMAARRLCRYATLLGDSELFDRFQERFEQ
jgi:hypothetical protein